jgi:hypothetical protein
LKQLESLEDEMLTDGQQQLLATKILPPRPATPQFFVPCGFLNGLASVSAILGERSKE